MFIIDRIQGSTDGFGNKETREKTRKTANKEKKVKKLKHRCMKQRWKKAMGGRVWSQLL